MRVETTQQQSPGARRLTPFVKWAGGKSQLLPRFAAHFPVFQGTYYEPFLGGGAVFLALRPPRARLSDLNAELINCWQVVQDHPVGLMRSLDRHRFTEAYYYRQREVAPSSLTKIERASRFIFLNKTCYNGLYRVNRQGRFNVPFGRFERPPKLYDRENLRGMSRLLEDAELLCVPFDEAIVPARAGDFVYFDPPYQPLSSTSNFTSYTEGSFSKKDQERLADVVRELDKRGCMVAVSNSDTPEVRSLYRGYRLTPLMATRAINSRADRRGRIVELLITNAGTWAVENAWMTQRSHDARRQLSPDIGPGA